MRLDGLSGKSSIDLGHTDATPRIAPAVPNAPVLGLETFRPTGDFSNLLRDLRRIPLVRGDAVAEAAGKLGSGELDGPGAAPDIAQSLLDSLSVDG